ncbi:YkvA family protein [Streptomyces sp. NPDC047706]|uniref:YkvA family protein n=1 Tax=Streptomyces sp. NPDC047706 TaxID=3365486 RepID=UPI00371B3B25
MSELPTVLLIVIAVAVVTMLGIAIALVVKLWKVSKLLRHEEMPFSNKMVFYVSLLYTFSPVDLLPDPVYLDDIGLLVLAIRYVESTARRLGVLPDHGGARSDALSIR